MTTWRVRVCSSMKRRVSSTSSSRTTTDESVMVAKNSEKRCSPSTECLSFPKNFPSSGESCQFGPQSSSYAAPAVGRTIELTRGQNWESVKNKGVKSGTDGRAGGECEGRAHEFCGATDEARALPACHKVVPHRLDCRASEPSAALLALSHAILLSDQETRPCQAKPGPSGRLHHSRSWSSPGATRAGQPGTQAQGTASPRIGPACR
eukprot:1492926-Rhodomonas_salina.1